MLITKTTSHEKNKENGIPRIWSIGLTDILSTQRMIPEMR